MAEPLKARYGPEVPRRIGAMIAHAWPAFDRATFERMALDGYDALELMPRAHRIAQSLAACLPADYERALEVLMASLDAPGADAPSGGLASFVWLPHTLFVAANGLGHFDASMRAQHRLTQRFTAEFSLRAFIEHDPARTFAQLERWTGDPSEHVRRLVSEGTRPRLPWAPRLRALQRDPRPALVLLERLKDDPSEYVRRSVANHLNDVGKDHPALLIELARRWWPDAGEARRRLLRHALRSLVKAGHPDALALLGFRQAPGVRVAAATIRPARPRIGERVAIGFDLANDGDRSQRLLVDCRVHYVKAGGRTHAKVFKLKTVDVAPRSVARFAKSLSLAELTTRRHYPGEHRVDLLVNGRVEPLGRFELLPARGTPAGQRRTRD